jgi:hypothetical protein
MRRKIAVFLGLLLLALLAAILVGRFVPSDEVPLRVGMDEDEVDAVFGDHKGMLGTGGVVGNFSWGQKAYYSVDWLGNRTKVSVFFLNHRVDKWEREILPRTRPPWLKWANW